MPRHAVRTPRPPARLVSVRDAHALAAAVAGSGMSLRRVAVTTRALSNYQPGRYESVTYQTLWNLVCGRQVVTALARAQAIEEALRVSSGQLFTLDVGREQGAIV